MHTTELNRQATKRFTERATNARETFCLTFCLPLSFHSFFYSLSSLSVNLDLFICPRRKKQLLSVSTASEAVFCL